MKRIVSYIISHLRILYLLSILAVTVCLILLMFPDNYSRKQFTYSVGSYWSGEDVYAPYDFAVLKTEEESRVEE